MPFLSNLVVYAGGYLVLVFVAVCLATGLYYLAEMVEEYTRVTKRVLKISIQVSIALDLALLVIDRLPFLCCGLSIAALCAYNSLLRRFPFIEMSSPEFLASVALLIANHFAWMRHFRGDDHVYYSMEYLLGFFLMVVWIVPFGFFISLAANESVLPGSGLSGASESAGATGGLGGGMGNGGPAGAPYGGFADMNGGGGKRKRANVVLQVLDFGKVQWERFAKRNVFPNGMPGASYKERVL